MKILISIGILIICFSSVQAQDCLCQPIEVVNVCYIPRSEYCPNPSISNCGLTLDHPNAQQPGLTQKIANLDNFGPNGVVLCAMNLVPMVGLNSAAQINDQDCHIFYVGNFPGFITVANTDSNFSAVPDSVLEIIYQWSIECPQNLAIVKQNEAIPWGYSVENQNQNPNRPSGSGSTTFSIFDGPFGQVSSFLQGGGFQGVFTQTADTGFDILAQDANQRPTILLDHVSNDLLLGDVGIISSNGFGSVTEGPNISNANDILAANIFALGCSLATESIVEFRNIEICLGDSFILPKGQLVLQEGAYVDSFKTETNCDSIIRTNISFFPTQDTFEEYVGCEGDNYSVVINNVTFNEANPRGVENILDENGCEILVEVDLVFNSLSSFTLEESICPNDGFQTSVGGVIYDESNLTGTEILQNLNGCDSVVNIELRLLEESFFDIIESPCFSENFTATVNGNLYDENNPSGIEILQNSAGCDSIVNIDIRYVEADTFNANYFVCSGEPHLVDGIEYFEGQSDTLNYTRFDQCDSVLVFDIQIADNFSQYQYDSVIIITQGRPERIKHQVPSDFTFDWAPSEGLSCNDCSNPIVIGDQIIEQYEFRITDQLGCEITKILDIKYITDPYIPNIFSPNGLDERNQSFRFFIGDHLSFKEEILVKSFSIFDRWGQTVHKVSNIKLDDPTLAWEGNVRGNKAREGVYIYEIILDYYSAKNVSYQGTVTLIN